MLIYGDFQSIPINSNQKNKKCAAIGGWLGYQMKSKKAEKLKFVRLGGHRSQIWGLPTVSNQFQ
jgi:hypothetical protein